MGITDILAEVALINLKLQKSKKTEPKVQEIFLSEADECDAKLVRKVSFLTGTLRMVLTQPLTPQIVLITNHVGQG